MPAWCVSVRDEASVAFIFVTALFQPSFVSLTSNGYFSFVLFRPNPLLSHLADSNALSILPFFYEYVFDFSGIMQQQEVVISQEAAAGNMDAAEENLPKAAASRSSAASWSRRPRVREVSSRFMSPVVSSSSSSSSSSSLCDLHLSSSFSAAKCLLPPKNHHHHQRSQSVNRRHPPSSPIHSDSESEPLSSSSSSNSLIIVRNSLDTPLPLCHQHPTKRSLFASNKLLHLKENGDPHLLHSSSNAKFPAKNTTSSSSSAVAVAVPVPITHRRTDTPTIPRSIQNFPTPATSSRSRGYALVATTAAAKLVQSTGLAAPKRNAPHEENGQIQRNNPTPSKSSSANDPQHAAAKSSASCDSSPSSSDTYTMTSQGGFCDNPPIPMQTNENPHPISGVRSSMPEEDLLPTMSARPLGEDNSNDASFSSGDLCRMAAFPCHRSLNSPLSNCHQSLVQQNHFADSSPPLFLLSHFFLPQSVHGEKEIRRKPIMIF